MPTIAPHFAAVHRRAPHQGRTRCVRLFTIGMLLIAAQRPANAQTLEDGLLVPRGQIRTTVLYGRDQWNEYWEGDLKRASGNIGTLTRKSVTWMGGYGVTEKLSLFASVPYVWTEASQGVMRGQRGRQDLTVLAKYQVLGATVGGRASLRVLAEAGAGAPTTDYTPDFQPLSIGLGSRRALARAAVHLQDRTGLFFDASSGRAWRSNVRLDRSSYYADGRLIESDVVDMPDVFDYMASIGYQRGGLCLPVGISVYRTLGGSDIRLQDMPFVSNRMNGTSVHAQLMYVLPKVSAITVDLGVMHTLRGRNVGQSTMIASGFTLAFNH